MAHLSLSSRVHFPLSTDQRSVSPLRCCLPSTSRSRFLSSPFLLSLSCFRLVTITLLPLPQRPSSPSTCQLKFPTMSPLRLTNRRRHTSAFSLSSSHSSNHRVFSITWERGPLPVQELPISDSLAWSPDSAPHKVAAPVRRRSFPRPPSSSSLDLSRSLVVLGNPLYARVPTQKGL